LVWLGLDLRFWSITHKGLAMIQKGGSLGSNLRPIKLQSTMKDVHVLKLTQTDKTSVAFVPLGSH
jgi:hypothetical protein